MVINSKSVTAKSDIRIRTELAVNI